MDTDSVIYQIHPLGFCGAPDRPDGSDSHRILHVTDWIGHLTQLGITHVLFNPVFASDQNGYDIRDPFHIDPRLGTDEDFRTVCDALHEAGIGVILDIVFNHAGRGLPQFQDVLEKKWDSPYCGWFFLNFDDTWAPDGFTYGNWEGHNNLVKLNLNHPDVRAFLFQAAQHWIETVQPDGFRISSAYCMDRGFLRALSDHLHALKPDLFLLGEMIGGDYTILLNDCGLDSVTNYQFRSRLCSSLNAGYLPEIADTLNRQFGKDPWCQYTGTHLLSFADNHDTDRIASVLNDPRDLPLAYDLLYAMPGIPCLYYGSEWGITGTRTSISDDAVRPSLQSAERNALTLHLSFLASLRRAHPVLFSGSYEPVYTARQQLAFIRRNKTELFLYALNTDNKDAAITIGRPLPELKDLLTGEIRKPSQPITLKPKQSLFLFRRF